MAIKFYIGGPGTGKSLFSMEKDIIPAFFTGRHIFTNINGIDERIENTSIYLKKYHKKNKKAKIKELNKDNVYLQKEILKCDEIEVDTIEENLFYIESNKRLMSFIENPDYSADSLKSKFTFMNNEDKSRESATDKTLYGDVIQVLNKVIDDDMEWNREYMDSIFVFDESKKFFSPDIVKKFDDKLMAKYTKFIGEHRHNGFDITFIDQEFWKSTHDLIRTRTQTLYSLHDSANIGIANGFFASVYVLLDSAMSTFEKAFKNVKTINGRYNKELFKCYRSVQKGARSRNSFDKSTVPFFSNVKNVIGVLVVVICLFLILVYKAMSGFGPDKTVSKVSVPKNNIKTSVPNKIGSSDNKKNVSKPKTNNIIIDYSKHPVFELIKNNKIYCNGYLSDDNFDFNYRDMYDSYSKKTKKSLKNEFLGKNYSDRTSQMHYLTVVDDKDEILFVSDTKRLAEYYHFEVNIIDNCFYKIKYKNELVTVYPFEPISDDVASNGNSNSDNYDSEIF